MILLTKWQYFSTSFSTLFRFHLKKGLNTYIHELNAISIQNKSHTIQSLIGHSINLKTFTPSFTDDIILSIAIFLNLENLIRSNWILAFHNRIYTALYLLFHLCVNTFYILIYTENKKGLLTLSWFLSYALVFKLFLSHFRRKTMYVGL